MHVILFLSRSTTPSHCARISSVCNSCLRFRCDTHSSVRPGRLPPGLERRAEHLRETCNNVRTPLYSRTTPSPTLRLSAAVLTRRFVPAGYRRDLSGVLSISVRMFYIRHSVYLRSTSCSSPSTVFLFVAIHYGSSSSATVKFFAVRTASTHIRFPVSLPLVNQSKQS